MHHLKYLRELLIHKWHVFRFCCKLGIPWRGITHDLSRFLPDEWFVHARFFCADLSDEDREALRPELDAAYVRHIRRNDHHWQHWMMGGIDFSKETGGGSFVYVSCIPHTALREMLADWKARALYRDETTLDRFLRNRGWLKMHPTNVPQMEYLLPIVDGFQ